MATAEGIVKGVLYFILAVIFVIVTYYLVPVFTTQFSTPFVKALFYIGLIATYITQIVIVPILLITNKIDLSIGGVAKGGIFFALGLMYTLITMEIVPEMIELFFNNLTTNMTLYGMFYAALIISQVLAIIVVPNIFIFKANTEEATI